MVKVAVPPANANETGDMLPSESLLTKYLHALAALYGEKPSQRPFFWADLGASQPADTEGAHGL